MCNCGHDGCESNEADRLRKRAVQCGAAAACMAAIPALFVTSGRSHHVLVFAVIAMQVVLLVMALHFIRQRRRLS
jgi:hypothetical protein